MIAALPVRQLELGPRSCLLPAGLPPPRYLHAYAPPTDRTSPNSTAAFLLSNVKLALEARNATSWGRAVPKPLFLNEVLPFVNIFLAGSGSLLSVKNIPAAQSGSVRMRARACVRASNAIAHIVIFAGRAESKSARYTYETIVRYPPNLGWFGRN
jgi:hypothetical protein